MKKRNLLAMAALSCFAFTANAAEYWVIKDGELSEDIKIMPNTTDAVYDVLTPGNAKDGAKYQHKENPYKDVQLDMSAWPVSLKDTWIMEMEYKVPATALDQTGPHNDLWGGKKPMFIFAMYPELKTTDDKGDSVNVTFDVNVAPVRIDFDGKLNAQADTWTTVRQYVYANPSIDECKVLTLSYCREVKSVMDPVYIKNLKFIDAGSAQKPFYAEDFEGVGGKRVVVYSNDDNFGKKKASQVAGGKQIESVDLITVARDWEENGGHDGSGFMADEHYHAMVVPAGKKDISINGIEIPAELSNGGEIAFKAYIKNQWIEGTDFATATEEQRVIPALIKFDNGTEYQLTDSLMDGQWDAINSVFAVPAGAKTLDVIFKCNSDYGYLVDNIRIGANWIGDNVATIASDIEIEITPNPASDIITVSGDVEKIEVIALNGAVVASAEGNQANIAALAAGSYIVKAYTAEGIAIKMIIKK